MSHVLEINYLILSYLILSYRYVHNNIIFHSLILYAFSVSIMYDIDHYKSGVK